MPKPRGPKADIKREYWAEPTAIVFHNSNAYIRGIMGPVGSGKSTVCAWEIMKRAIQQTPYEGKRCSRWVICRNSYPELISTSMKTWQQWFPDSICPISRTMNGPLVGRMKVALFDKTTVDLEVVFLALDRPDDAGKLKSLELTGVWINEAAEISKEIFDMATSRVGRYPAKAFGGSAWSGVIMDTNPPDDRHWYYDLAEHHRGVIEIGGRRFEMAFFRQPPAIFPVPVKKGDPPMWAPNQGQHRGIPAAENINNLDEGYGYYLKLTLGKDENWIRVFCMGEYGTTKAGQPIYTEYVDSIHCAKDPFDYMRGLPVILGWDYGRTPSCVFVQVTPFGQVRVVDEIASGFKGATYETPMSIRTFARDCVRPYIANQLGGCILRSFGDPAGAAKGQTEETTCMQILSEEGISTVQARTQDFTARRDSVARLLRGLVGDGQPEFLLSPRCLNLRRGFQGYYRYRQRRTDQGDVTTDEPDKTDPTCQPHDALQYACLEAKMVVAGYGGAEQGPSAGSGYSRRQVRAPNLSAYT